MYDLTPEGFEAWARRQEWFDRVRRLGLSASAADRRAFNLGVTLEHPQYAATAEIVEQAAALNSVSPTRRRLVGVDGDFKAGKTEIVARIAVDFSRKVWAERGQEVGDEHSRSRVIPVFFANASTSGEADLMRAIHASLGLPLPPKSDTAAQMLHRVVQQCRRSLTVYGFIDDANMLATSGRLQHLTQFSKRMLNELPVTLVYSGSGLAQSPVLQPTNTGKADQDAAQQVARRMSIIKIRNIKQDGEGAQQLMELLREAAGAFLLTYPEPLSGLIGPDLGWLLRASEGRIGDIFEVLALAAHDAVGKDERLTGELLRRAWALLHTDAA